MLGHTGLYHSRGRLDTALAGTSTMRRQAGQKQHGASDSRGYSVSVHAVGADGGPAIESIDTPHAGRGDQRIGARPGTSANAVPPIAEIFELNIRYRGSTDPVRCCVSCSSIG